jgi:tRNA A37 threonylcarbamoyltransferase TsaD
VSSYTLGIDTSNYATSLAVFDTAGEVVCAKKRFLPVKEGQLGLRQSDALFHHTAALPEMLKELSGEFDLTKISAVGVSEKPRPVEGSYMPCFLAGVSAAEAFALARGIPLVRTTHQQRCLQLRGNSCLLKKFCCSIFPAARLTCSFAMK